MSLPQISSFSRDDYRLLVESVADYAIFMLDPDGRVASWNLGAERIKGYRPDEIIGEHFSKFYPPDEIARCAPEELLRRAATEGRVEHEGWRLRKDGSRFRANVVITALREPDGTLRGYAKVTRDLTERWRADEELRRSEERFRLLVEGVTDYAIYLLDPQGRVTTWNAGAERIKGYPANEITGRHFSVFFTREDIAAGKAERELEIARQEGRFEDEAWRIRKDGTRFWANVVLTALRDSSGELVGFAKVTRDLTSRRQAEETARELVRQQTARMAAEANEAALRASNERYEALSRRLEAILEGMPDGVTVQDRSGRLLFGNTAAARACGFDTVSELLGAEASEILERFQLLDEHGQALDPEALPGSRVLRGESPGTLLVQVRDHLTSQRSWSRIRASAIFGLDGTPELAINVWHDVTTERRREEEERLLAAATSTLSSSFDYEATLNRVAELVVPTLGDWCAIHLLEGSELEPVAVAHVDPERSAEARELHRKYPPQPNVESGIWQVVRTGQTQLIPEVTQAFLDARTRGAEHAEGLRRLGIESAVIVPISIRENIAGALSLVSSSPERRYDLHTQALAEELARRVAGAVENARLYRAAQESARHAEAALRRAEEASRIKDEFLATVSHELRTPLQSIVGWATLLRERNLDPSSAKGVEVIHRNAQAQGKLIEDILDVSRIITGKLRLELQDTDLREIVQNAVDVVRASAVAKRISIDIEPSGDETRLVADPERLQQVVWNLLSNALKFTDSGGKVTVRVTRDASRLVLSVTDTGRGIDAEFLPYVFDRFQQADSSTTRRVGGLGLGLAIVRHIVELHGGYARATSGGPGQGATFTISLPVRAVVALPKPVAADSSSRGPAPARSREQSLGGVRVLIVDDEPDARELLGLVLSEAGASVTSAGSAVEALALLAEFRPHVLVSDVGMPDIDGYAMMRHVRELDPRLGGIPAIALTAYTRADEKMKAITCGFTTHVGKPVDPEDLIATVANLAKLSPRRSDD